MLIANLNANAAMSKKAIVILAPLLGNERPCDCDKTLSTAIITRPDLIPPGKIEELGPIVSKYY
jgi:hypothetical protein